MSNHPTRDYLVVDLMQLVAERSVLTYDWERLVVLHPLAGLDLLPGYRVFLLRLLVPVQPEPSLVLVGREYVVGHGHGGVVDFDRHRPFTIPAPARRPVLQER